MIPHYWSCYCEGWGEHDSGDVFSKDGEYIGTWALVDGVFVTFTPEGEGEHLFFEPHFGILCQKIGAWHEEREAAKAAGQGHTAPSLGV